MIQLTEVKNEFKLVVEDSKQVKKLFQTERVVYVNPSRINYICQNDEGLTLIYFVDDLIIVKDPVDRVARFCSQI